MPTFGTIAGSGTDRGGVGGCRGVSDWCIENRKGWEPPMNADSKSINDLSEIIIGRALVVSNLLGADFLEKVYENALAHELRKAGLAVRQQHGMEVRYDGIVVGSYTVDLLVENLSWWN
jgi:hypothetical protein